MIQLKKILFIFSFFGSINSEQLPTITVIGIGRLGLCTALCLEQAGYDVVGVDLDQSYVNKLNNKTFCSFEPSVNDYLQKSTHFHATTNLDEGLSHANLILIIVDTPSTTAPEAYDHSRLGMVLQEINKRTVTHKHIVICCTVFPGYIDRIGKFLLKDCIETTLSYNPEFIAQGDIIRGFENPDIVLIGQGSSDAGDILEYMHKRLCRNNPTIFRMSAASAELAKLAINCFITTKIAFANMVGDIADNTPNADKEIILRAVGGDSRIGYKYLKPGYGFGGPCFPRDNRAFASYARSVDITPFIPEATDNANKIHAQIQAAAIENQNPTGELVFEDVAYKPQALVPIIEESQKLAVAAILARKGRSIIIRDRSVIIDMVKAKYGNLFTYEITD